MTPRAHRALFAVVLFLAVCAVAGSFMQRKVGARGLRMILEELMLDLMYYVPGNKKAGDLTITAEMVKKHSLTLLTLLEKAG